MSEDARRFQRRIDSAVAVAPAGCTGGCQNCDVLCANCHRREHYTVPDAVTPPEAGGETSLGLE
ncbi:MAG: hypothetical protein ABEH58_03825 [Haloplanus sp.]